MRVQPINTYYLLEVLMWNCNITSLKSLKIGYVITDQLTAENYILQKYPDVKSIDT